MNFDYHTSSLPIVESIPDIQSHLENSNRLIVHAPPGAGKSTLLPLALLDSGWLDGKKIIMLEPRRLAARAIAERMSDLLGESVGDTVGYRIRFENKISSSTKIEVVTEGILTRILHADNALEDIGLVIFDEFHERSIHADVALALCRESQTVLRPDLRIMLMSATLDMPNLIERFDSPVVESLGKQYPVDVQYLGDIDLSVLPEMMASNILKISHQQSTGDILAFFPGEGEIRRCEEILKQKLSHIVIAPLYGQLPSHLQYKAIIPDGKGRRKIVLATSIAETSLTIEGIKIVVDCGFTRMSKFDPKSGLSRLETLPITIDAANQRSGRAGRLSAGYSYRLWSKATQERLEQHRKPEIVQADLAALMLDMAKWGVKDIQELMWLTQPPHGAVAQATDLLHQLEALDNHNITQHGLAMHKLPCHPRIAHMLIMADAENQLHLATDIAPILEEKDPLDRNTGIDINLRVEGLRRVRQENRDSRSYARIEKIAASYRRLFEIEPQNDHFDPFVTGVLLAYAYPERIASARPGNNAQFQLANGRLAMASHKDDLVHEPWLAIAHLDARDGMGKIFLAAPLNPKDLIHMVKEKEVMTWDTKKGGFTAQKELRIGSIVLRSSPMQPNLEQKVAAISDAIAKEGQNLLNFDDEFTNWQNRILSLRYLQPNITWPDVETNQLLKTNSKWLAPFLIQVKSPDDLKKINLKEILSSNLDYELQLKIDRLAPEKIIVPSGSGIRLQYQANGMPPILAVRLQEMFGMTNSPTVNDGKTSVLLHLLSPGYKPVQVTTDLKSFWENTYFEVRKELKRRYPKHEWPDNPLQAQAIRGVNRKPNK